jgi:hypothetical protein
LLEKRIIHEKRVHVGSIKSANDEVATHSHNREPLEFLNVVNLLFVGETDEAPVAPIMGMPGKYPFHFEHYEEAVFLIVIFE